MAHLALDQGVQQKKRLWTRSIKSKNLRKAAKNTRRNERKRELKKEHQVVNQNKVVDFSDQEAQARLVAAATLKTGRKRLSRCMAGLWTV